MFAHWARKKGNHKMSAFYVFPFPALRVTRPPLTLELRKTLRMSLGSRQEYHVPRAQRFVGSMFCLDPEKARPWSLHYTQHYYVSRSLFFLEQPRMTLTFSSSFLSFRSEEITGVHHCAHFLQCWAPTQASQCDMQSPTESYAQVNMCVLFFFFF